MKTNKTNTNTAEARATRFNESVDYFCLNYGNPFEDCAINLISGYRDMMVINESWAVSTICKVLKRMSTSMLKKVAVYSGSTPCYEKYEVSKAGKDAWGCANYYIAEELGKRGIYEVE